MHFALTSTAMLLVIALSGCAVDVVPTANNFSIEPKYTNQLRGQQRVALVNGYTTQSPARYTLQSNKFNFDRRQMTDTAITMLGQALEKQGILVDPKAEKTIWLQVAPSGMTFAMFRYTGKVTLAARFGDGKQAHIPQENLSPMGWERAFEGAMLFALQDLLEHENFVAYLNSTAPQVVASSAPSSLSGLPACTGDSASWSNCAGGLTAADGSRYEGEFKEGKYHGKGQHTLGSGSTYVGEFENGKYHGRGTAKLMSGSTYVGEFRDGKMNGQITFTAANGNKYVGEFKDNRMHGQGIATRADGSVIHSGTWANGKPVK